MESFRRASHILLIIITESKHNKVLPCDEELKQSGPIKKKLQFTFQKAVCHFINHVMKIKPSDAESPKE